MRAALLVTVTVVASLVPSPARAQTAPTCKEAFSAASKESMSGHLLSAREDLRRCSAADCPSAMAPLCADDLQKIAARVPTVVFVARDGAGHDLRDVRVLEGGTVVQQVVDGRAVDVDPGPHSFRFERPDGAPIESDVVVREDEKGREILATFPTPVEPPAPEPAPVRPSPPPVWAWIAAGVSAASFVTFGVAAASGDADYRHLEGQCGSSCPPSETTGITTKFVVADVALGIGVVAVGLATWLFLRHRDMAPATTALSVHF